MVYRKPRVRSTLLSNRYNGGFTLMELIFVMSVAAILLSIALPSYKESIKRSEVSSPYKSLRSTLALAKTEAISRNKSVVVCASDDQASCGNDWNKGWIAFVDANGNSSFNTSSASIPTGDELLAVNTEINSKVSLSFSDVNGNAANTVTFNRQGFARGSAGEFILCSKSDDRTQPVNARGLFVFQSGIMRMSTDGNDSDDIHEDSKGVNITCP